MTNKSIKETARQILADRQKTIIEHSIAMDAQRKAHELEVRKTFEEVFADVLNMLREDEVGWSAHMNDPHYTHKGYYILFQRHGLQLRMDFTADGNYRYEFTGGVKTGNICYGKWNMDDFIVWIAQELKILEA